MKKSINAQDVLAHGVITLMWCKPLSVFITVKNKNGILSLPWTMKRGLETCEESLNRLIRCGLYMSRSEPFSKRYIATEQTSKGYSFAYYFTTLNSHCIQHAGDFSLVNYSHISETVEILEGGEYPEEFKEIINKKLLINQEQ